ncbi:hypothetical protein [uncultured Draconibacterium sp.]|uniref:hypothetical protein n=1 Tax=uncultured Draconibacterium sp. TaxID=1573823 RepID=UPI0025DC72D1|nr:hypothetical protein [uncultured Draconibacterium sp.]
MKSHLSFLFAVFVLFSCTTQKTETKINRFELVNRHNVQINDFDSLSSLSVGNGKFALTVDATGLQTFPQVYKNGVCLGTMSEWGWHSFPNTENYKLEEAYKYYDVEGRKIAYAVQWKEAGKQQDAANYFRVNPHRLQLANIGLELLNADNSPTQPSQIKNINQQLNLWEGVISSSFEIEESNVEVTTFSHSEKDKLYTQIKSDRLKNGLVSLKLQFPYPTGNHVDNASDWNNVDKHQSEIILSDQNSAIFQHTIDTTTYFVKLNWIEDAEIAEKEKHYFVLQPKTETTELNVSVEFNLENNFTENETFDTAKSKAISAWKNYWSTGGIVDFSGTEDKRAYELERRVILSQYLTRIQCAGNYPPQETGLTFNSWYGKFHLEMHWWHAAHWSYWNRSELMQKSLDYYFDIYEKAKVKAEIQGYEGVRWPKMTDNSGNDSPSGVGEFLIWQQPHIIYFAEQLFQENQDKEVLKKYLPLVSATADFMASFARWDEKNKRYILGPPLIPAQESLEREVTFNPPFELGYWHWGLSTAQNWLKQLGLPTNPDWQVIIDDLSEFAHKDGLYLAAESAPDSYENEEYYSDHPMVLGAFGILPETLPMDTTIMANTFDYIEKTWNWERTWGWDYPMAAMCATRLGKPDKAIDLLLKDVLKNTYLANGHNYQGQRLRIYLPGNGGLLTAVAMMCAGFEGNQTENPGFPEDWDVKWENISPVF